MKFIKGFSEKKIEIYHTSVMRQITKKRGFRPVLAEGYASFIILLYNTALLKLFCCIILGLGVPELMVFSALIRHQFIV